MYKTHGSWKELYQLLSYLEYPRQTGTEKEKRKRNEPVEKKKPLHL